MVFMKYLTLREGMFVCFQYFTHPSELFENTLQKLSFTFVIKKINATFVHCFIRTYITLFYFKISVNN